ncbi:hypothetical protein ACLK19_26050 [Escherichia coli]
MLMSPCSSSENVAGPAKTQRAVERLRDIEMPLVPVLSRIERNGVKINPKVLHNHSEELTLRLAELEKKKAHKLQVKNLTFLHRRVANHSV